MEDWKTETAAMADQVITLRAGIARAATARAEAHLEICRGRETLLVIAKRAIELHKDAKRRKDDPHYFEATAHLLEFVNSAGVEAQSLEMMMQPGN